MRILAMLVLAGMFAVGCHHNKPAQTPADQQNQSQPPPVQGPPP